MNPINKITSSLESNAPEVASVDLANSVLGGKTIVYKAKKSSVNNAVNSDRNFEITNIENAWIAKNGNATVTAEVIDLDRDNKETHRTLTVSNITLA
jgi:hypothetical protein